MTQELAPRRRFWGTFFSSMSESGVLGYPQEKSVLEKGKHWCKEFLCQTKGFLIMRNNKFGAHSRHVWREFSGLFWLKGKRKRGDRSNSGSPPFLCNPSNKRMIYKKDYRLNNVIFAIHQMNYANPYCRELLGAILNVSFLANTNFWWGLCS